MGIEARHRQARIGDAEIAANAVRMISAVSMTDCRADRPGHLGQRHVDGQRHHPQFFAGQHHHRAPRAGQMGEKFGMAGKGEARSAQDRLVDGRGDHGGGFARQARLDRDLDRFDHRGGIRGIGLARQAARARPGGDQRAWLWEAKMSAIAHQLEAVPADLAAAVIEGGNARPPARCRLARPW